MAVSGDQATRVVWLEGDQDIATVAALSETMAEAIAADDADLVVDLSGVQFLGVAPIAVLVRARTCLGLRSRTLSLRAAPPAVARLLRLCGYTDLLDNPPASASARGAAADALATWVAVPVEGRADASPPVTQQEASRSASEDRERCHSPEIVSGGG